MTASDLERYFPGDSEMADRRLETLRKFGIRLPETRTVEAACQRYASHLSHTKIEL